MRSSAVRSTESTRRRPAEPDVPSLAAWERVLDRLRMKLPGKPSRTEIFGRAGLRYGKMYWMRQQPDLRSSVIVKLAKVLQVKPGAMLEMILREAGTDRYGNIRF